VVAASNNCADIFLKYDSFIINDVGAAYFYFFNIFSVIIYCLWNNLIFKQEIFARPMMDEMEWNVLQTFYHKVLKQLSWP
jgi:hypothetical protein